MAKLVRIPKAFYDDHAKQRELPAPPIVRELARHYVVDACHPDAAELLDDACHYSDVCSWSDSAFDYMGLQRSARSTAETLAKAAMCQAA